MTPSLDALNDAGPVLRTVFALVFLVGAFALGRWFLVRTLVQSGDD